MRTKSIILETALAICIVPALVTATTLALVLAIAVPFMWLWNAVPAVVFNAPVLGYWQTVGLLVLITLVRTVADGVKLSVKLRSM